MSTQTYWIQRGDGPYREVTLEEWCSAERSAKGGWGTPATAGFSTNNIRGTAIYGEPTPEHIEQYATWNPSLAEALTAKYFPMYRLVDGFLEEPTIQEFTLEEMQQVRKSLRRMAEAATMPMDERSIGPETYLRRSGLPAHIVAWVMS